MASKSPYEILGVSQSASQDEIRNAFRAIAKKNHPDLNPGNKEAERKFKEANSAYEIVGDEKKRAQFDRGEIGPDGQPRGPEGFGFDPGATAGARGRRGPFYYQTQEGGGRYSQSFGEGMDDEMLRTIFERMGMGGMGGASMRGAGARGFDMPGEDVQYELEIGLREAVAGATRELALPNGKRLEVKIPAGVDTGANLRFAGQGEPGIGQGQAGDAFVRIRVRDEPPFRRRGDDLELELPVTIAEAVLGGEVRAPTIEGAILLKIPEGSSTGRKLRVPGKGAPNLRTGKRGDLVVSLKIVAPRRADADLKEALRKWSEREAYDPRAELGKGAE